MRPPASSTATARSCASAGRTTRRWPSATCMALRRRRRPRSPRWPPWLRTAARSRSSNFISNAPWRHEPVIAQIGRDADRLLGGKPDSALIIDESSFVKQGDHSVGVVRQWCGRLGKVDNCQVAVFAVLTDGTRHTPVDMRLYLPQRWIDDPARCDRAEIPPEARTMRSKTDLALELVRAARARGMRFGWVGVDGGYGKEPAFLRALDDMGEIFVADVHCDQRVWSEPPGLHVPAPKVKGQGRPPSKQQAAVDGIT